MLTHGGHTNSDAPNLQCIPQTNCEKTSLLILLLIRLALGGLSPLFLGTVILVRHGIQGLLDVTVKILCEIFIADL